MLTKYHSFKTDTIRNYLFAKQSSPHRVFASFMVVEVSITSLQFDYLVSVLFVCVDSFNCPHTGPLNLAILIPSESFQ